MIDRTLRIMHNVGITYIIEAKQQHRENCNMIAIKFSIHKRYVIKLIFNSNNQAYFAPGFLGTLGVMPQE